MINDVTTDLVEPPRFASATEEPDDFDKASVAEHTRKHGDLRPLHVTSSPQKAFADALRVAKGKGWKISISDPEQGQIEAVAITKILRFRDDVVIRVRAEEDGSRVDVRSKSRLGKDDFGANAKRITSYLHALSRV